MKSLRGLLVTTIVSAVVSFAAAPAVAEIVTFTKDAPLRAEPSNNAAAVMQVKANTQGEASGKKGPFYNIKVANATGWALTTEVNFGTAGAIASGNPISLGSFFGPSRASTATSTVGIRGFDKETYGRALDERSPIGTAQLALLDSYMVNKDAGQAFASGHGLQSASIGY